MNWTYVLLGAILLAIILFNGELVHQVLSLRRELREDTDARLRAASQKDVVVIPPKEPRPRKSGGMPTI
jgi:hypothetical protein